MQSNFINTPLTHTKIQYNITRREQTEKRGGRGGDNIIAHTGIWTCNLSFSRLMALLLAVPPPEQNTWWTLHCCHIGVQLSRAVLFCQPHQQLFTHSLDSTGRQALWKYLSATHPLGHSRLSPTPQPPHRWQKQRTPNYHRWLSASIQIGAKLTVLLCLVWGGVGCFLGGWVGGGYKTNPMRSKHIKDSKERLFIRT